MIERRVKTKNKQTCVLCDSEILLTVEVYVFLTDYLSSANVIIYCDDDDDGTTTRINSCW